MGAFVNLGTDCAICDEPIEDGAVCESCREECEALPEPVCDGCEACS